MWSMLLGDEIELEFGSDFGLHSHNKTVIRGDGLGCLVKTVMILLGSK